MDEFPDLVEEAWAFIELVESDNYYAEWSGFERKLSLRPKVKVYMDPLLTLLFS